MLRPQGKSTRMIARKIQARFKSLFKILVILLNPFGVLICFPCSASGYTGGY